MSDFFDQILIAARACDLERLLTFTRPQLVYVAVRLRIARSGTKQRISERLIERHGCNIVPPPDTVDLYSVEIGGSRYMVSPLTPNEPVFIETGVGEFNRLDRTLVRIYEVIDDTYIMTNRKVYVRTDQLQLAMRGVTPSHCYDFNDPIFRDALPREPHCTFTSNEPVHNFTGRVGGHLSPNGIGLIRTRDT